MHVPLVVAVDTLHGTRNITKHVHKLKFRKTAPGGHASAGFVFHHTLQFSPDELEYYGDVSIIDGRSGKHIWDGRQEDPGRAADTDDGEAYDLVAGGGLTHAEDDTRPLIYVDRRLSDAWDESGFTNNKVGRISIGDGDVAVASIKYVMPPGTTITIGEVSDILSASYQEIREASMKLARVSYTHKEGFASTDWRVKAVTRVGDAGALGSALSQAWTTGSVNGSITVGDPNFSNGDNVVDLRIDRDGSSRTATSVDWALIWNIVVRAMLKDINGNDITTGYALDTVYAHEIIKDVIGRMMPKIDTTIASIVDTTFAIEQLVYGDGATARQVFDDMTLVHPTHIWEILERQTNGKYRFNWRLWPTTVRYDANIAGGYSSQSSGEELYNQARVRYRDKRKRPRWRLRTQTVPELDAASLTRTGFVDLGENVASSTAADKAGDEFLADHLKPLNAGRLGIDGKIFDRLYGRMVDPWEIEPGYLIRARGVSPFEDSLNATTPNGITVFRIVEMEYDGDDNKAELALDAFPPSVERVMAQLAQARRAWGRTGKGPIGIPRRF